MSIIVDRYVRTEKEFEVIHVDSDNYLEVGRLIGARYVTVMHDLQEGVKYIEYRGTGALIKTHIGGHIYREKDAKHWDQLNEEIRTKELVPKGFLYREIEFAPPYDR